MGKSPDSGGSRQMITNSGKYGITTGSYKAEFLELTPEGRLASGSEFPPRERLRARFSLAIDRIASFSALYESQVGNRLPAASVLEDIARDSGVPTEDAKECVETFTVNIKFLGVLRPIAGTERIIPLQQAIDELPNETREISGARAQISALETSARVGNDGSDERSEWDAICFYISPIGDEGTEHRDHSNLFLGSIVEPALEEFGLKVIRADKIGKPGMITSQILEHILKSKLVIADLSFHNPNVFYELCLRHACRLPTVQIIRKANKIPFDLDQYRTIEIDTTDIYTLVPRLQSYKAEIATQVRTALRDPDASDNPISTYYPNLKVTF